MRKKIFAFYGSDIKEKNHNILRQMNLDGYDLFALDTLAASRAEHAQLPWITIDDWIDWNIKKQLFEEAKFCERNWYRLQEDDFSSNGVCWADIDRNCMHCFWWNFVFSCALAKNFVSKGIQEIIFFEYSQKIPGFYYYNRSSIHIEIWKYLLKNEISLNILSDQALNNSNNISQQNNFLNYISFYGFKKKLSVFNKIKKNLAHFLKKINIIYNIFSKTNDTFHLEDKIVLAFSPNEFVRFTPFIKKLSRKVPGAISAVVLSPYKEKADRISEEWSIPVFKNPVSAINQQLQKKFLTAYEKTIQASEGKPWEIAVKALKFHFNYYCTQRWPKLASDFDAWLTLWKQNRPKAVIVSALLESEAQLPALAAKRLYIPTVAIPHGSIMRVDELFVSDHILIGSNIQKKIFKKEGFNLKRLILVKDILNHNEYHTANLNYLPQKKWGVLCLSNFCGYDNVLPPLLNIRDQIKAFKIVNNIPLHLINDVELKIKTHPNPLYSDWDLIKGINKHLKDRLLPVNLNIQHLLKNFDLIISINYSGSALLSAYFFRKPVIYLKTTDINFIAYDFFTEGGLVVNNHKEFWESIEKFFNNDGFSNLLKNKSKRFYQKYIDNEKNLNPADVILTVAKKPHGLKNILSIENMQETLP